MSSIDIGVFVRLTSQPGEEIKKVADLGLASCQVGSWNPELWTSDILSQLRGACEQFGVKISTFWAGYSGPRAWNFIQGPTTIGLVPPAYRAGRVAELLKAVDFARQMGVPSITTHVGFIPEDPNDPNYDPTVEALKTVASACKQAGLEFWFETGQETPVALLRTIDRMGLDTVGINLDAGNLILYGKANPVDALDVFGKYVRGVHAKDGLYPVDGDHLGREVPLGEGKVNFPVLIPKLRGMGFTGAVTIEREISGPKQLDDIRKAIALLRPLCA